MYESTSRHLRYSFDKYDLNGKQTIFVYNKTENLFSNC